MKEVTWRVPSSTVVRNEKRRRERNRNAARLDVKDDVVSRNSCDVVRRVSNRDE